MDILIVADFCGKMDGTNNSRFLYLAEMLSKSHDVEILTSDFDHGTKKYFTEALPPYPFKISMVHEGSYKRNISINRFIGHYIWSRSVKKYFSKREKPDAVFAAIPPLSTPYVTAKYCRKNNIRFVIDIQDLWPEAFQMVIKNNTIGRFLFCPFNRIANKIYENADAICGVSQTYVNRALCVNSKTKEGNVVYLGTDLDVFDENVKNNPVEKPRDELWLGYCGTLGASYDLTIVIQALNLLKKRNVHPPKFVIMGDGERRREFERLANELEVECVFTGKLPYDQMCGRLAACDIAVNPIMHNAAQSIINKHADYAASGLPVLNTQESIEYRDLVDEYQMGYNCSNSDANDLADKMAILLHNRELREKMGRNSRRCAEERFDRAQTYRQLVDSITKG